MENLLKKYQIKYKKLGNYYFTEKGAILAEDDRIEITKNIIFWLEIFKKEKFEIPVAISSELSEEYVTTKDAKTLIKEYNEEKGQYDYLKLSLYNEYIFTNSYKEDFKKEMLFYFNTSRKEIVTKVLEKIEELKNGKLKKVKFGFIQFKYSLKVESRYDFINKQIIMNKNILSSGDFLLLIKETEEKIKNFLLNGYEKLAMNLSEVNFTLNIENKLMINIDTKYYSELKDKIELPYNDELALEFLKNNIKFLEPNLLKVRLDFSSNISKENECDEVQMQNVNTLETTLPFIKIEELNDFRKSEIEKAEVEISRLQNLFSIPREEAFDVINYTLEHIIEKNKTMELMKDLMSTMEKGIIEIIDMVDIKDKEEARIFLANEMWFMLTNQKKIITDKKNKIINFVSAVKILNAEQNKVSRIMIKELEGLIRKQYTLEKIIENFKIKKIERMKKSFLIKN